MTEYKKVDLTKFWENLPKIPSDHIFKGIPISVLHDAGWRYDELNRRYFIPYWSASKTSIPFAQWRNLSGGTRFNFWKDAKPTCYGTWNLDNHKIFIVEGTSDAMVLEYCSVPYVAMPSAASTSLIVSLATYCQENGIQVIYAGDNDLAGDKLREALDEVIPYRVKQPPKKYKDWGEFFEAEGLETVQDYCKGELFGTLKEFGTPVELEMTGLPDLLDIQNIFPGSEQISLI